MLLPMSPTDSVFLTVEARQRPMHVGGLHLYRPPEDAGPDFVRDLFAVLKAPTDIAPILLRRPARSITTLGQWGWEVDDDFDLEHHVRHNALPHPARILELLALCSRLHSTLLDRSRPLWETHLIEGLQDGRFAMYFKVHHALLDGVAAARMMGNVLSTDPDRRDLPAPWAVHEPPVRRGASAPADDADRHDAGLLALSGAMIHNAYSLAAEAAGIPAALGRTVRRGLSDISAPLSFSAPRTMFNVPISGSRRFAAQSWPMARMRAVGKASHATLNDVVLAMCSGALRAYLQELGALPDAPLVAMVPVALRAADLRRESGNAVGAVMCNLATNLDDPGDRLAAIAASMQDGKEALSVMSPLQIVAMTALGTAPLLLQSIPGINAVTRPPFNLIISNVPGPRRPMYLNGAKLEGGYPLSVPFDGQALNITCTSYVGDVSFGLIGCRRSVPHLQRLLGHLDNALSDLEKAAGISSDAT
jgi:diacylglycerol O-acyltransferase